MDLERGTGDQIDYKDGLKELVISVQELIPTLIVNT